MRIFRFPVLLAALASGTLVSCASSDASGPATPRVAVSVDRLRAEPFSLTLNSGLNTSERIVIRDADSWRATWSAIWQNHTPPRPLPEVDFAREVIIVAALGERSTHGYHILIDSATANTRGVTIHVRTQSPGPRCGRYQAFTQPVDVARLPRTTGPVTFRERAVVTECR